MSLELGSRLRLPDGRLVEVVPDTEKILGINIGGGCFRCAAREMINYECLELGCIVATKTAHVITLSVEYPRILKEVEDEP